MPLLQAHNESMRARLLLESAFDFKKQHMTDGAEHISASVHAQEKT